MKTEKPKVAVELNGKPLICHVIENIQSAGIHDIVVIVGYKKEEVIEICKPFSGIRFCEQKEQLGTAHALMSAEDLLGEFTGTVIVAAGDVPLISPDTFRQMADYHSQNQMECTVLSADMENPFGYGRIIRNDKGYVESIVEEKDASENEKLVTEINTGTYCFNAPYVFESLKKIGNDNAQKEYYLPDLVKIYKKNNRPVGAIKLQDPLESHGINSQEDLKMVSSLIKERGLST